MTIDKAIEILTLNLPTDQWNRDPRQFQALKMGIEALKAVQATRIVLKIGTFSPLPGETTD